MTNPTPTINGASLQPEQQLPKRAVRLALRAMRAMNAAVHSGDGRIYLEVIEAHDGSWMVFVNNGQQEHLGRN